MEQLGISYTVEGMQNGTTILKKMWQIFRKSNTYLSYDSAILPSGILLKRNGKKKSSQKDLCKMFIALFKRAKNEKQTRCPSKEKRLSKLVFLCNRTLVSNKKE